MRNLPRSFRLLAFLSFGLGSAPLAAQSITGTVNGAHQPLVGATVRLLELDRVTHTDAQGRFTFGGVPSGTYRLFATVIGFAAATDTVTVAQGTTTASFDLVPSAVSLQEIVISASPTPRTAEEQYQASESKSKLDLLNTPGQSFSEKISDLPGVNVRGNGSAPTRPILRGLGDNEVLVLENGLRVGDIATYDPAHATPLEGIAVQQIDVVRGPATILYGPNTIGGLVNVITDMVPNVTDHALSGTVAAEGNTVSNLVASYANAVASNGTHAFRLSAGETHAGDVGIPSGMYVDPASGAAFQLDHMPQTFDHSGEVGAGYAYQSAGGMIGVGGKHYDMNYGIPGVPPNPDFVNVPPTTSRITQTRNTAELRGLFVGGTSFASQWRINAVYNDYSHSEFPTAQDSTGVSDPQANHFHKTEFNGVLQMQQRPVGNLTGALGLWTDVQELTIGGDQPLGPNSTTTGFAGYAYEEYRASPSARLQAGLRYDYNKIQTHPDPTSSDSVFQTLSASRNGNAVTASLGAIGELTPNLSLSFSVARSFRAPTVQELYANGLDAASGTFSVGSSTLGPETGLGFDASLRGSFDRAVFEVSPYVNTINHYIYAFLRGDTIDAFPVRQFAAADARLVGGEASANVEVTNVLSLQGATDYVQASDIDRHVPLPFIPPLRGLLRATYQDPAYMGMVEWRGAAGQTRLGDGDTPTGGYGLLNLGAGIRLTRGATVHSISLHCDNVFDKVYRDHTSVIKDFLPQPGRGFRLDYQLSY